MSIDIDRSEIMALAADMSQVGSRIAPLVRKAVEVTARGTEDTARRLTKGSRGFGPLPATIDYTMVAGPDWVGADIGFNKGGQGSMGHWWEYGSRHFPARGPLSQSLDENAEDFVKGLTIAAEDALGL